MPQTQAMAPEAARASGLEEHIRQRAAGKKLALMAHIICGYPSLQANGEILAAMDEAGVDVVELQFPFSDPIADGPIFLAANQQSLRRGTRRSDCFALLRQASQKYSFKLLFMGYYNTILSAGEVPFCRELSNCGACGLIVPDLPLEEAGALTSSAAALGMDFIRLAAPTNTPQRLRRITQGARGFVYAVARKGVTGKRTEFDAATAAYFKTLRELTAVPLAVGFGIREPGDLRRLLGIADMAVLGTAVLQAFTEGGARGLESFLRGLTVGG